MDFNPPHIPWAGDIFQKLEAMCLELELEDVNWEEGLQYVEKQLQTVSNNVKKFCSDVVTDVLTTVESFESSTYDSSLVVNTDRTYDMPKECVEKCICGKELCNTSHLHLSCPMEHLKATKHDAFLEEGADDGICGRSDLILEEKHSKDKELELEKSDDISLDEKRQSKPKLPPTSNDHLENNICTTMILGDASSLNAVDSVVASGWKVTDSEHDSGDVLTGLESDRKSDFGATLVSSPMVKLEESCILVDKSELSSVLHERQESNMKQLKKKASDTNWTASTQDHNQEATLHVISDLECSQVQEGFASPSIITTTPDDDDDGFSDSEWEIL